LQGDAEVCSAACQVQCTQVVSRFFGAFGGAAQPTQGLQMLTGPEQSARSFDRNDHRLGVE
jgi:hypothetical protein